MPPSLEARLLELVGDVLGLLEMDELQRGLMEALARAIPATYVSLNTVGPAGVTALVQPEVAPEIYATFGRLAHQNPLVQHFERTRDGRPTRFSDVISREALEATELYQQLYGPLNVPFQIALTLPCDPDNVLGLVLTRGGEDFSDEEKELLTRARPYLIQAYRNAMAFTALRSAQGRPSSVQLIAAGLTSREAAVLALVADGGSNREVGEALSISERTVQKHLQRTFAKLGVHTRSAAVARARQLSPPI